MTYCSCHNNLTQGRTARQLCRTEELEGSQVIRSTVRVNYCFTLLRKLLLENHANSSVMLTASSISLVISK